MRNGNGRLLQTNTQRLQGAIVEEYTELYVNPMCVGGSLKIRKLTKHRSIFLKDGKKPSRQIFIKSPNA